MKRPIVNFYGVALPTLLISILGLVMVFSASSVKALQESGSSIAIVGRQAILFTVGVMIALLLFRAPYAFLKRISSLALLLSLAALVLPQIPGIGKEVNGNRNWISLGGFTMQPSEFAKLGMILWIAGLLARHESQDHSNSESKNEAGKRLAAQILPGIIAMLSLILVGRDLGTALVFAAIAAGILFIAGVQLRWFIAALAAMVVMATVLILTQSNRVYRIKALLDPFSEEHYQNAGWQPAHSIMGLASGGIFGSGLGAGKQKWGNLAEAHTDFIFAVVGEEMGLLGTLTLLGLFAFLLLSIFKIALRSSILLERFFVSGVGIWFAIQIVVNIGSVTGLIPVIGVTLPLVSYGGSSLIATLAALGLVLGVAMRDPEVRSEINRKVSRSLKYSQK
jgi:cell division protein FtsW